jgi:hypothetical protein
MESTANGTVRKYVNRVEVSEANPLPATALDTSAIPSRSRSRSRPSWQPPELALEAVAVPVSMPN